MRRPEDFDLLDPKTVDDPYPFYAALREHDPVHRVADTDVYLVSSRSLIEEALERQDDFSANLTGALMTGADGKPQTLNLLGFGSAVDGIANADEPAHAIHRKLVLPQVTPRVIASFESTLREWASDEVGRFVAAGGGDWVSQVANPIPTRAMAQVVGLPLEDTDRLLDWAMTGTEVLAGTTDPERMNHVMIKTAGMTVYLADHLQEALAAPPSRPVAGVLGELARGVKEGLISEKDGVSILVVLVGAGGESTSSLTGSAARILAEQPSLQAELRADPTLIPDFVEEVVRLEPSFKGHYRAVKRDTELGGVKLPEGSRVLLLWAAANRDPEMFEHPDQVDIHRTNLREHISFGRGIHFCVGARLARLEARVILEELLGRTRGFGLDPEHPPRYVSSIFVRRHAELCLRVQA